MFVLLVVNLQFYSKMVQTLARLDATRAKSHHLHV